MTNSATKTTDPTAAPAMAAIGIVGCCEFGVAIGAVVCIGVVMLKLISLMKWLMVSVWLVALGS